MPSPGKASLGDSELRNREHADEAAEEAKALDRSSSEPIKSPARESQDAEESKAPDAGNDAAEEEKKERP